MGVEKWNHNKKIGGRKEKERLSSKKKKKRKEITPLIKKWKYIILHLCHLSHSLIAIPHHLHLID
jgi:hypothetical protein